MALVSTMQYSHYCEHIQHADTQMARTRSAAAGAMRRQRKTLDVDQRLLDQARAALAAPTETEAVRRALDRVVRNQRIADGIRRLAGRRWVDRKLIDR